MKTEVLARLASKKKTGRLDGGLTLCEKKKRRLDAGITLCGSRKKSRRLAVTTAIEKLGELELEMILLKLPALDLVRCKRVCRAWRSLISSDYFVMAHLNRSRSDPSSHKLLVRSSRFSFTKPGPFKSIVCFQSGCMITVGSVNGLICFVARMEGKPPWYTFPVTPDNIWIMNPLTGLCRKLPSPSSYTRITCRTTTSKFVFWCDGVYKVAKIVSYTNGRTMIDLWESTSPDTWTSVNATTPFRFRFRTTDDYTWVHACEVLIEGVAAYWIVFNCQKMMFVLSLDLKTLTLKAIPLPKKLTHAGSYVFCGIMNGDFVLLHQGVIHQRSGIYNGSGMFRVWTIDDDGKGSRVWKKIFKVCFDFIFSDFIGIVKGKLVFQFDNNIITLYDLETTQTKEVLESDPQFDNINMISAHGFVGSLVSLDGFGYEYNDRLKRAMRVDF